MEFDLNKLTQLENQAEICVWLKPCDDEDVTELRYFKLEDGYVLDADDEDISVPFDYFTDKIPNYKDIKRWFKYFVIHLLSYLYEEEGDGGVEEWVDDEVDIAAYIKLLDEDSCPMEEQLASTEFNIYDYLG